MNKWHTKFQILPEKRSTDVPSTNIQPLVKKDPSVYVEKTFVFPKKKLTRQINVLLSFLCKNVQHVSVFQPYEHPFPTFFLSKNLRGCFSNKWFYYANFDLSASTYRCDFIILIFRIPTIKWIKFKFSSFKEDI